MEPKAKIKEIIFFTYGDSSNASTWSNVPYLFTEALSRRGITVRRVDLLGGSRLVSRVYNKTVVAFLKMIFGRKQFVYDFSRTTLFKYLVERNIKKAVTKFSTADYCIFTNFDFYNKFNEIPTLLFCDWTYKILVLDRLQRKPYWFERRFCQRQETAINHAECVISLFPKCAEYMRKDYPAAHIHHLDSNVINSLYAGHLGADEILRKKKESNKLLFIGGKKYLDGAKKLVEAFKLLGGDHKLELHLIGLTRSMFFNSLPDGVHCHGYLRKDVKKEQEEYYDLLISSKMIINPTPLWGGYSSTIEAMYFYTPVIISPYDDFVTEFGRDINFGIYNEKYDADTLAKNIIALFQSNDYESLCRNAHDRVKDYTWDNYVGKILRLISH